jgi:adenylate cyclase
MDTPEPVRKSLAIVFCDIAGFTELIATQGDFAAVSILRVFFEHVGRLAKEYQSLTIKFIGDAFLATFENIADVMPFINSIQGLLEGDGALSGRGLAFKLSLHVGEVIYTQTSYGPDIFGEHVNTAAHLNARAEPNQLAVSQPALDRLPHELRAQAGPSEVLSLRRLDPVEFRRISLPLPTGGE